MPRPISFEGLHLHPLLFCFLPKTGRGQDSPTLEIGDAHSTRGKYKTYKQTWEENMSVCHAAEVTTVDRDASMNKDELEFTKISFVPDLAKLTGDLRRSIIPEEEYNLMKRRVVDIAGCADGKLTVTLNGEPVSLSRFQDYVNLYRQQSGSSAQLPPTLYHKINARWEIVVGLSEQKSLESISFVNGMNTSREGTHVDVIARQISQSIADYINTKMSKELDRLQAQTPINISPRMVRRHLFLCVNSLIENPSFDSQMKECLTSNPENFGSNFDLTNSFLKKLTKPLDASDDGNDADESSDENETPTTSKAGGPGIVEQVISMAMGAHQFNISKLMKEIGASSKQTKRQVLSIPELEDATLQVSSIFSERFLSELNDLKSTNDHPTDYWRRPVLREGLFGKRTLRLRRYRDQDLKMSKGLFGKQTLRLRRYM
eukprot:scaffold103944_cov24-Cyclotella_meneghiniana.AAC.1